MPTMSAAGPFYWQQLTGRLRAAVWRPVDGARRFRRGKLTAKREPSGETRQ